MPPPDSFPDRLHAGRQLGDRLRDRHIEADIVLAVPRGGLPLGRAVADALDAPLDIVVAQKIGAPDNPEYAIGAVASDGSVWRNDRAFELHDINEAYFETERKKKAQIAREKVREYGAGDSPPDVRDATVVVVDDGVATGATMRACLQQLQNAGAGRIVVALPVGPPDTVRALASVADEVICLLTPSHFRSVGEFYRRFEQVSDDEAMGYL